MVKFEQLELLIRDVGGDNKAARLCDVHISTVRRWRRGATPLPMAAYRTLYGASQWGRSERTVMTTNYRAALLFQIEAQGRLIAGLEAEVQRLLSLGDFGTANQPLYASGGRR